MRLADPLRDFSQPSVEPCVAYVSDPLPMAGPDDPVLLSFETSAVVPTTLLESSSQ